MTHGTDPHLRSPARSAGSRPRRASRWSAACAADVFGAWTDWNRYCGGRRLRRRRTRAWAWPTSSARTTPAHGAFWLCSSRWRRPAALFLTWLWRARANARAAQHRRAPAAPRLDHRRLVLPDRQPVVPRRFILDDIWRTSGPGVPTDQRRVHGLAQSRLVRVWWFALIGDSVLVRFLRLQTRGEVSSVDAADDRGVSARSAWSSVLVAAVLVIRVIRQISRVAVGSRATAS